MNKPKRGEVWRTDLEPTRGDEMQKTRPAIVVSDENIGTLDLCVVVPLTEWKDRYGQAPWMVRIDPDTANGLSKPSAADAFQVRSVSIHRMRQQIGTMPEAVVDSVVEAVALCLGYRT